MPPTRSSLRHVRLAALSLTLVLFGSLIPVAVVSAATTVTAASGGGSISADTAGTGGTGAYTALSGPVLHEGAFGELNAGGSVTLTIPAGFNYNTSGVSVSTSGAGCDISLTPVLMTITTATVTINGSSTAPCTLTFVGLQVRPTNGTPLASGNITNTGNRGPTVPNYGTLTEVAGSPVLSFTSSPTGSTQSNTNLAPQPVVQDKDQFGTNRNGDMISLTVTPGTGTAGAALTCNTNPVSVSGGSATFAGCRVDKVGSNYKLRASTTGGALDSTNTFSITPGPANHLAFLTYPAVSSPALLSPQPAVAVEDSGDNVLSDNRVITLSINQNAGTFACNGGVSMAAVGGVASFTGCTESVVANGYSLTASASGLPNLLGSAFNVTSGPASKLTLCWGPTVPCNTIPPSPITAATPFSLQPTVLVQDINGNTVPNDNTTTVTLSILGGTPVSGGPGTLTCTGGNSKLAVNGVATFSGCMIDKLGTGYRLLVTSSPAFTSTTSNVFNVVPGAPVKLGFVSQPGNSTAGTPFATNVAVAIEDAGGNIVTTGIVATVALSIGFNPGAGTLTCTGGNVVTTVNGVGTFTGCSINNQGVGYTLVATATSSSPLTALAAAVSLAFTIAAPPAVITITPSSSVITWGGTVIINVHFVNNGVGKSFVLQTARDGVTWSTIATLTTDGASNASFAYRPSDNRYYRAVFAGTPDLSAGTSLVIRVVVRQISVLRPTNKGSVKTVSRGTNVTFTTTVRPNRPELPTPKVTYRVYQLVGGHWNLIVTRDVTASSAGLAQLTVSFSSTGQYYVRSFADPTPFNANSVMSPIERYNVI